MTPTEKRAATAMIEAQHLRRALRETALHEWAIFIHVGHEFYEALRRDLHRWAAEYAEMREAHSLAGFPVIDDDTLDPNAVQVRAVKRIY